MRVQIFLGVNANGLKLFRTDTKEVIKGDKESKLRTDLQGKSLPQLLDVARSKKVDQARLNSFEKVIKAADAAKAAGEARANAQAQAQVKAATAACTDLIVMHSLPPEDQVWTFANVQSWSCVPETTCTIAVGPKKYVLQTELGEDICALLKSYALTIVARQRGKQKAKGK